MKEKNKPKKIHADSLDVDISFYEENRDMYMLVSFDVIQLKPNEINLQNDELCYDLVVKIGSKEAVAILTSINTKLALTIEIFNSTQDLLTHEITIDLTIAEADYIEDLLNKFLSK